MQRRRQRRRKRNLRGGGHKRRSGGAARIPTITNTTSAAAASAAANAAAVSSYRQVLPQRRRQLSQLGSGQACGRRRQRQHADAQLVRRLLSSRVRVRVVGGGWGTAYRTGEGSGRRHVSRQARQTDMTER